MLDFVAPSRLVVPVTALRISAARHVCAAILIAVLALAGVGRGLAADSGAPTAFKPIPGMAMPICHSGEPAIPDQSGPGGSAHHDCCDACALCAPVIVSAVPEVRIVARESHAVMRSAGVAWGVRLSRARTPRQAQGPPAA